MRLSIHLKLDDKKMKKHFALDNIICEYAQVIEVLRGHGFVHRAPSDPDFINVNAKSVEDAQNAIKDLQEKIDWFSDFVLECSCYQTSEPVDIRMIDEEAPAPKDDGEKAFEESVRRFAEAFFALTDEEKEELRLYAEGRCKTAKEEYNKRNKKK